MSSGERLFILQRVDRRPVFRDQVRLDMMSSRGSDAEAWVNAFKAVGIFKELHGDFGKSSFLNPAHPTNGRRRTLRTTRRDLSFQEKSASEAILEDKELVEQTKHLRYLIEAYMKIADKTIKDLIPKYIVLSLVRATQEFIKRDLTGLILKDRHTEDQRAELLQEKEDYRATINELLQVKEATEKALEVFMRM